MSFQIITLDTSQNVTAFGNPVLATELVLRDPNGGPAQPISNSHPVPAAPVYGVSGIPAIAHNFVAPNEYGPQFAPIAGRPFNVDLVFSNDADARMRLLRSFDQGATWSGLTDGTGNPLADFGASASCHFCETETGVIYCLQMSVRNAGSVQSRISQ